MLKLDRQGYTGRAKTLRRTTETKRGSILRPPNKEMQMLNTALATSIKPVETLRTTISRLRLGSSRLPSKDMQRHRRSRCDTRLSTSHSMVSEGSNARICRSEGHRCSLSRRIGRDSRLPAVHGMVHHGSRSMELIRALRAWRYLLLWHRHPARLHQGHGAGLKAAEKGHTKAQYSIGIMYDNGEGVVQDYQQVMEWFLKAAVQGYTKSQYTIGALYHHGRGVFQDYKMIRDWFLDASEKGHTTAQYELGRLYKHDRGVPVGYSRALKWFIKAAEQGEMDAKYKVGLLFEHFGQEDDAAESE